MGGGAIPVGDTLRQIVLALGAALLFGGLAVVVRERRRPPDDDGPRPNWTVVVLNIVIGSVLAVWGLASLLVAR